jgi:uncharacterized membrane protein YGL010W
MAAKSADQWFQEYGESHQHSVNKLIHWICVPLIAACVIALLWELPTPSFLRQAPLVNWATLVIAAAMAFYLRLSLPLAAGMLLFSIVVVAAILAYERFGFTPVWQAALAAFVVAWIGQFIGHSVEGKKPSFLKDLQFLLIGPIWLLAALYRKLGIRY